jgi:hypothetical protein
MSFTKSLEKIIPTLGLFTASKGRHYQPKDKITMKYLEKKLEYYAPRIIDREIIRGPERDSYYPDDPIHTKFDLLDSTILRDDSKVRRRGYFRDILNDANILYEEGGYTKDGAIAQVEPKIREHYRLPEDYAKILGITNDFTVAQYNKSRPRSRSRDKLRGGRRRQTRQYRY